MLSYVFSPAKERSPKAIPAPLEFENVRLSLTDDALETVAELASQRGRRARLAHDSRRPHAGTDVPLRATQSARFGSVPTWCALARLIGVCWKRLAEALPL